MAESTRQRVCVTGASGKAGRSVVRDLLEHGYDVVATDIAATAETVERLMGSKPEARFAFIQERAPKAIELVDV